MTTPNDSEIELKLAIHPGDAAAFRKLPLLCETDVDGPVRRKVVNVYFDTPGLELKRHGMALRLRKTGGKWLQTLKTAGSATGGLHQRGEWQHMMGACELDLALFRDTPLAALPDCKELHLALKPVFTTEFQRTTWRVETSPGQRVEVALDQGVIRCGASTSAISEVEIELLEGSAATVFDVALNLATRIVLTPEILSKAERGYRLFQPGPLTVRRAGTTELKRKWSPQQALQPIVATCLEHFMGNVEGALTSDAPEYIHQLRVALRRLRSALRTFKPPNAETIDAEVKWLAGTFGDTRDWDVLLMETLPALLEGFGDSALTTKLTAAGNQRQAEARRSARAALTSSRATLLILAVGRMASVVGEPIQPAADASDDGTPADNLAMTLSHFASKRIRKGHRRLLGDSTFLGELSPEARHQVRIDAKRLRYAVDFFSSLFNETRGERYATILGRIQDQLGGINDAAVAMKHIESLEPPERFIDFARGWFVAQTQAKLAGMGRHFVDLKKAKRFWLKQHTVARR